MEERHDAVVAWAFDVQAWQPGAEEWARLLASVQPEERARVAKFHFEMDRKRALAGRVMIRALLARLLGVEGASLELQRTPQGKPFLARPSPGTASFNLSHHGKWVVLVAHPRFLVGVDVMDYARPRGVETIDAFFETMADSFTAAEWAAIRSGADEEARLRRFYQTWSLKESYIKALGAGLGFGLQRASFTLPPAGPPGRACLTLDGNEDHAFMFGLQELDPAHCVAVAVGRGAGEAALPVQWQVLSELPMQGLAPAPDNSVP